MQIEKLGPYRIGKKIGKGGMGAVYEAVHEEPGQQVGLRVAVKALSPQLAMAEGFRERFEAEIESLKKLQHEGIVRMYGYGQQDGILFYSMELVEGDSLEEELNAGRRFSWRETIQIGIQICRALKHAHDHGVIHRDIKPANLLLTPDERVKIADFGIARLFGSTQLTSAGGVLGTADYMSPEQADGRLVTEKCDQYSLGGVLYALLAGRPPFRASTMPEMLQMQRFAKPEPVRRYAPDTPEQFDRLLMQLLSKDPADRFPNVLVLGRHMEAMEKALTRPIEPEDVDADVDRPASVSGEMGIDAAARFGDEASNTLEAPAVLPIESATGEAPSQIYEAPTLALPVEGSEATTTEEPAPEPLRQDSRFITVDEESRRQRERALDSRWTLAAQLAGLLAALATLVWGGWYLMQPATSDELFEQIMTTIQQQGADDLRVVSRPLKEFLARFPEDPRAAQLQAYREQLEFQKFERQARLRARLTDVGGAGPLERVYFSAMAAAKQDPARGLAILKSLLALYDPAEATAHVESSDYSQLDDQQRWLFLARRQVAKLQAQVNRQAAAQLPALRERLAAAAKLQPTQPERARRMYQALIDLYAGQTWAREIVEPARRAVSENAATAVKND